ncbi:MAG: response regulator transcription factor [Chloroflexi bacterium]|nr:response regulator transcription factor [Chloroflexota bacterium]MBI3732382.1 response regulator transcription factor [Chloroflexota bacterium]
MEPIRILLADDHPNVRTQIRARLNREPYFDVVDEAINSRDAIQRALTLKPDVLLIDTCMRDGHGLIAVNAIAVHLPKTAVVVLTAVTDTAARMQLRQLGVGHILDKDLDLQQLVDTLRQIGRTYLTEQTLEGGLVT